MFPHLRLLLISLWTSCIAGGVVIAGLTMGYYNWQLFLWAVVAGFALGVPAALANWAYLRPNRARELGLSGD